MMQTPDEYDTVSLYPSTQSQLYLQRTQLTTRLQVQLLDVTVATRASHFAVAPDFIAQLVPPLLAALCVQFVSDEPGVA
jgi:hypothetical protein